MESQRLVLIFVFMFSVFMLLDAWQREQQPPPAPPAAQPDTMDKAGKADPAAKSAQAVPSTPTASEKPVAQASVPRAPAPPSQGKTVRVETDLVVAHIGTLGGGLQRLELKQHRDTLDKAKPFVLLDAAGEHGYVAQSGLTGGTFPNHHTLFQSAEDT